jgi:hypothetical protein
MSKNKFSCLCCCILFTIDSDILIDGCFYTDEGYNQEQDVQMNTSSISK